MMQLEVRALTSTISVAVAQAAKEAMAAHQASFPSTATPTPSAAVEQVVQNDVISYTPDATEQAPLPEAIEAGDQPSHPFCSIALNLGCGRTLKSKRKFGLMNILTLGHYYLSHSLTPCSFHGFQWGCCKQPQLTLECYHTPKKVPNISQWLIAFNPFVSIYSEKCSQDAPKLIKYCEVARYLTNKSGDCIFYVKQFLYLRQSSPELCPCDQIH